MDTRYAVAALALGLATMTPAQVDLTQPFQPDADTAILMHLDDAGSGEVSDAAGGPGGVIQETGHSLGRFGEALSLSGSKGWVDITRERAAQRADLTVECWAKFRSGAHGDIICRNQAYMMRLAGAIQAYISIDGKWRQVHGGRPIPVGRWVHLAMTYDHTTKQVRTYVDGHLDVARVPEGITDGKLDVGSDVLRLGTNTWSTAAGLVEGKLDEVRISNVARQYTPLPSRAVADVPVDTNLVRNPSFELGLHGWRPSGESNALLQWSHVSGDAPHGTRFIRSSEPGAYSLISGPITVVPGAAHTLSAMLRADRACRTALSVQCTGVPSKGSRPREARGFDVTAEWRRFSMRFTVPTNWPTERAYVEIRKPAQITLDADAVSLVVGDEEDFDQTGAAAAGVDPLFGPGNTFAAGKPASLPIRVANTSAEDRGLTANCTIEDYRGHEALSETVFDGTVQARGSAEAHLAIPTDRVGWFTLRCEIFDADEPVSEDAFVYNVVRPMVGVGTVADSPIGMNTHMEREPNAHLACNLSTLSMCGVKWIRAWWGWGMAEKRPGSFDWTEYDRQLEAVHAAGMEIMPILLRYYPSYEHEWAGKVDRIQQPPNDVDQWARFVETTVRRYRGRVKCWEIWNEPQFTMQADYYARLLKVTYDRIKMVDPRAEVVGFGGVSLEFIKGTFEAGSARCMDILSHHSYGQLSHPFERMQALAADTATLAEKHEATRRVWHSEQGTGADGVGYAHLAQSEQQCATNLIRGYLSALSTGVEKFFWFSAQTSPTYGWAVFYENYIPRPRLVALNGLARLLEGRRVTGRADLGEETLACVLLDGDAGPAAAVWGLAGDIALALPAGQGLAVRDMLYNPLLNAGTDAVLTAPLRDGRPVYITATGMDASRLVEVLKSAQLVRPPERSPVRVTVAKAGDDKLRVDVRNTVPEALDLRVSVSAPALFTRAPASLPITDLAPDETGSATFTADRAPTGARCQVEVTIEVGRESIRTFAQSTAVEF